MFSNRSLVVAFLAFLGFLAGPSLPAADLPRPRLAVLLVFDQMRGDYPTRWKELFGEGGFRRLLAEGASFTDCHYPYALTATGPGHASLMTGCSPDRHGIIGNSWYDVAAGAEVYCVGTDRYLRVPSPAGKKAAGAWPGRLLQPTLGEALKKATDGKGRVVSLSLKDRAAVLMAGRKPDACYWWDKGTGRFVTSTYYAASPHDWVTKYNLAHPADRWFGKKWEKLRPELDYAKYSGPDDVKGEATGSAQGRTFPHPMGKPDKAGRPGSQYYGAVYNSPFGNELLAGLVREAVKAEKLGADEVPDLLCVSFSSNDTVGHCWGPDSQEVMDITLRSDRVIADLLAFLDDKVGKGNYIVGVSADHGICPLIDVARKQGKDSGRVSPALFGSRAEEFLNEKFPAAGSSRARWIAGADAGWVYLNKQRIREHGLDREVVARALAGWLAKQKGIQTTYTRTQLLKGDFAHDAIGRRVRKSFYPGRCGDVAVVIKPYHLVTSRLTGTNHGTPHPYDTHVPLIVLGPGVRPGERSGHVTPQAVTAIFARSLRIDPPAGAEASVPEGLWGE